MFIVSSHHTMANARPIERPKLRRERVIAISRAWERQNAMRRALETEQRLRLMAAVAINPPPRRTAAEIMDYVAWWHGLTAADLISRDNQKKWAPARFDAIAALRIANPDWSKARIGRVIGRDPTTVMHALAHRGLT